MVPVSRCGLALGVLLLGLASCGGGGGTGETGVTVPTVVSYGPPVGATGIPLAPTLFFRFSEAMDPSSFTLPASIGVRGRTVDGEADLTALLSLAWSEGDRLLSLSFTSPLAPQADILVTLHQEVGTDKEGTPLDRDWFLTFTTERAVLPAGLTPSLLSVSSWDNREAVTDGEWFAWLGRERDRVLLRSAAALTDLNRDLDGCFLERAATDGTTLAVIATDLAQPGENGVFIFPNRTLARQRIPADPITDLSSVDALLVGDGLVVWDADDRLYCYDITAVALTVLGRGLLPLGAPVLGEYGIAWCARDPGTGDDLVLFHDLNTRATRQLTTSGHARSPVISGQMVAWEESVAGGWQVSWADLRSFPPPIQTISTTADNRCLAIGGDLIAWNGFDGERWNLYSFRGLTGEVRTVVEGVRTASLAIDAPYLAWEAESGGQIWSADIFAAGATLASTITRMTTAFTGTRPPSVGGDGFDGVSWKVGGWTVLWEQEEPAGESGEVQERIWGCYIPSGLATPYSDWGPHRVTKSLSVAGAKAQWISAGVFQRVWVQKGDQPLAPVAVSADTGHAREPDLDGGLLAWSQKSGAGETSWDIHFADLSSSLAGTALTRGDGWKDAEPAADGESGVIAFTRRAGSGDAALEIMMALAGGIPGGEVRLTDDSDPDGDPSVDGGVIAWRKTLPGGATHSLHLYDTGDASPAVLELAGGGYSYSRPRLDGGFGVFARGDGTVWYHDLAAGASSLVPGSRDSILGDPVVGDGVIAFRGLPAGSSSLAIFAWDAAAGGDTVVTVIGGVAEEAFLDEPRAGGGAVCYSLQVDPLQAGSREVFRFDLGSLSTVQVTDDALVDSVAGAGAGALVWESRAGSSPRDGLIRGARP